MRDSKIVPSEQISDLIAEAQELVSMLTATVKTSQLKTKH